MRSFGFGTCFTIFTSRSAFHPVASPVVAAALAALLTACSSDGTAAHDPNGAGNAQNGAGATGAHWVPLLKGDWSLEPGDEGYFCVRKTVTEDSWIAGFRPISPPGTHHAFLYLDDPAPDGGPGKPDGVAPCDGFTQGPVAIFGSGVGTGAFIFPEDISTKIPAGKQLLLNLHVFNARDTTMTGTSGVEVLRRDPSQVIHEAVVVAAGKTFSLAVPPGRSTQTGTCTLKDDETIVAVGAHMHVLGKHMTTVTLPSNGSGVTLLDKDYSFDSQTADLLGAPVTLKQGDKIQVDCTYENPGASTVGFGTSTNNEMCFTGLYWYPPASAGVFCADD
jgi:hypothetical protein